MGAEPAEAENTRLPACSTLKASRSSCTGGDVISLIHAMQNAFTDADVSEPTQGCLACLLAAPSRPPADALAASSSNWS